MARDFWVYRYTLYDPLVMGWCKINPKGQFLIYDGAYRIILDRKKGIARLQPGLYDDFFLLSWSRWPETWCIGRPCLLFISMDFPKITSSERVISARKIWEACSCRIWCSSHGWGRLHPKQTNAWRHHHFFDYCVVEWLKKHEETSWVCLKT